MQPYLQAKDVGHSRASRVCQGLAKLCKKVRVSSYKRSLEADFNCRSLRTMDAIVLVTADLESVVDVMQLAHQLQIPSLAVTTHGLFG